MTLPHLRPLFLAVIFAAASTAVFAGDAYQDAISTGIALLEKRDLEKALTTFQDTVKADPARYDGYFYSAVASYRLGNLSAAEEYAKIALEKAADSEKPRVEETLAIFAQKRESERLEREGDEALAKGLRAKAADSYRKAYLLYPTDGMLGLKAASLYADTLKRLLDALVLWQNVITNADAESVAAARNEVSQRQAAVDELYKQQLARLKGPERKKAQDILAVMVQAFPDRPQVQVELAAAYCSAKDIAKAIEHLSRASALGADVSTIQFREAFIYKACDEEAVDFHTFITDAFGAETLEVMRATPTYVTSRTKPEELANLKKAVEAGHSWAHVALGSAYSEGRGGLAENKGEAFKWYQKAAELGDGAGFFQMGSAYRYGHGVQKDYVRAVSYLKQAAALGDGSAKWLLGHHYLDGDGVQADANEATRWWKEAAAAGFHPVLSELSGYYMKTRDYKEAIAWARKYAELEDAFTSKFGWFELGECYRDAEPPFKDIAEARRCFEKAASLGFNGAQEALDKLK